MKYTTLLTNDYLKLHRLFSESMKYYNKWFIDVHHIILYRNADFSGFDYVRNYIKNVIFVEVPDNFLEGKDTSKNLYSHFKKTYDKLFVFWADELKNADFVLYDADMICLRSFPEIQKQDGFCVFGCKDRVHKINTGFVHFTKQLMSDCISLQMQIKEYSRGVLSLPDQEIINTLIDCKNFTDLKILNTQLCNCCLEDLKNHDILHYITNDKSIYKFIFNNYEHFDYEILYKLNLIFKNRNIMRYVPII